MRATIIKKLLCLSVCFALLFSLACCGEKTNKPSQKPTLPPQTEPNAHNYTTFTTEQYQITLPKDFRQIKTPDDRIGYTNNFVNVLLWNEPFTVHPSLPDMALEEYAQKLIERYKLDTKPQNLGGVIWFEYQVNVPEQSATYSYLVTLYKTNSAFWCIEYVCDSRDMISHRENFLEWALSVSFTD